MTFTHPSEGSRYAEHYERHIGQLTSAPNAELIILVDRILSLHLSDTATLDPGDGTGLFAQRMLKDRPDHKIMLVDHPDGELAYARKKLGDYEGVEGVEADDMDLSFLDPAVFSYPLSSGMIGSTPDPLGKVTEMARMTHSGSVIGIASWKGTVWRDMWQEAVRQTPARLRYETPATVNPVTDSVAAMVSLVNKSGLEIEEEKIVAAPFGFKDNKAAMQ